MKDATSRRAALLDHFREQAGFCEAMGSPFTAGLVAAMGRDIEAGGPVADLVGDWPGYPRADALSLRLAGALHTAGMTGRDAALAAAYRPPGPRWDDAFWSLARAFLARDRDWVAEFLRSAPQTNEVRRSIGLLAGFLHLADRFGSPLDTFEIGASAGLNLFWDRFAYRTASWTWGGASRVAIDTDWRGPPPPLGTPPVVRHRAACDLNPLDIADPAERLRLRSYIWADQAERLARFDAAADVALAEGAQVERANAADWLEARLAERVAGGVTVVYHSVFLQYPSHQERARIIGAIEGAGARASASAPLAWLRLEPEALFGPPASIRFLIDVVTWPGGERTLLGETDGHLRYVDAGIASREPS